MEEVKLVTFARSTRAKMHRRIYEKANGEGRGGEGRGEREGWVKGKPES